MYENGSARDSYGAFSDDEPTAGAAEAKKKAELAKKQKETLKFNNVNLLLSMSGIKATSVQAPTMNGSIIGSAGLSQRNNSGKSYIVPATKNTRPITIFESLQIDRKNAPGEYKLDYISKAFGAYLESGKNYFTTIALASGMQPEYADIYGDFTMGMAFEGVATISITGLKSASNLSKGITSEGDIIVGSGFGNVHKGSGNAIDDFVGKLRGEDVTLKGVKTKEIEYVKRDSEQLKTLRNEFNTSKRKEFLKDLSNDTQYLKESGFTEKDILKLQDGKLSDGWQVHHKLPLDDSGTNSFDNLVLIKNEPYHKVITNYQNSFAKQLTTGETQSVNWPIPEGNIYPSKH